MTTKAVRFLALDRLSPCAAATISAPDVLNPLKEAREVYDQATSPWIFVSDGRQGGMHSLAALAVDGGGARNTEEIRFPTRYVL